MTTTPETTEAPATPETPEKVDLRFLLRKGWIGAIVGALAFTAACWLILAPWQFSRHTQQADQNHAITAALTATPVPVEQILSATHEPIQTSTWREVTATGVFESADQVYCRLRQDSAGNPAAEVIVPFRLTDGTTILLDRGYVPDTQVSAGIAAPPMPAGQVTITGRVQQDQPDPSHRAPVRVDSLSTVIGIDSTQMVDAKAGAPYLQGFAQLVAGTPGVITEIGVPQIDGGPYFSYALQWCSFGTMSILAICYFIYREATDPLGSDDEEESLEWSDPETADETPVKQEVLVGSGGSSNAAGDDRARGSGPDGAGPEWTTPTKMRTRQKRGRGGFDRSQLYD